MIRTTLLAKLVGDAKNCKWIYRFGANPGMAVGGILPPYPVLALVSAAFRSETSAMISFN